MDLPKPKEFDLGITAGGMRKLGDVVVPDYFYHRYTTRHAVLDAIFNGDGPMKSQTFSLAAPKGSGKTTILMQTMQALVVAHQGMRCAYFSNEECVEQLAFTAKRIGATDIMADNISDIDTIARMMQNLDLVVLDSYPGLTSEEFSQPKALEHHTLTTIIKAAKATGCIVIFVMHCTKTGVAAGSKNIYHAVDACITVAKMDPDLVGGKCCRKFIVEKNRFGSQTEVILQMTATGFDLDNPVEVASDESEEKGVYASRKETDIKAIMGKVRGMPMIGLDKIQAQISDFADLGIDMNRVERLLKELTNSGKLIMSGYGKGKRWTTPIDDDIEDSKVA